MRSVVVALLVACGTPAEPSQPPLALPSAPSASASPSATVAKRVDGPVGQVQDVAQHWLDLLARGEDERFIDEAVVPEELDAVLGSRTKAELVADFKRDKHDDIVKLLLRVQKTKPDEVRQTEDGRTSVKYEGGDGVRRVTFFVEGVHVWIHD